jgi:hypothetical protein
MINAICGSVTCDIIYSGCVFLLALILIAKECPRHAPHATARRTEMPGPNNIPEGFDA